MTRAGKMCAGVAAAAVAGAVALFVPTADDYTVAAIAAVPKAAIEAAGFEYKDVGRGYGMVTGVWYTALGVKPPERKESGVTSSVIAMHLTHCTGVPGEIRVHNDAQLTNVTAVIHR